MEPQTPIPTPDSIETPILPKPPTDNHWITIASMAIFVLLSLGAVAFLYYQNQQLKGMLANYQTPVVSPTPTATIDPTLNWETYTSVKAGFSLKYPKSLPIETSVCGGTCIEDLSLTPNPAAGGSSIVVVLTFKDPRIKTLDDYKNIIVKGDSSTINVQEAKVAGDAAISYKLSGGIPPLPIIEYAVVHNNLYYIIRLIDSDETKKDLAGNQKMFDQILSTFKFLGPSPTPTCKPRPACLDATPRCLIPETSDMCPASPTPNMVY